MERREPGRSRIEAQVLQPDRLRIVDQCAQEPFTFGQMSHASDGGVVDADVDELFQTTAGCKHTQCPVWRLHQVTRGLDNSVQHDRQRQITDDQTVRAQQTAQPTPRHQRIRQHGVDQVSVGFVFG